jgi:hypothetical protein
MYQIQHSMMPCLAADVLSCSLRGLADTLVLLLLLVKMALFLAHTHGHTHTHMRSSLLFAAVRCIFCRLRAFSTMLLGLSLYAASLHSTACVHAAFANAA